MTCKKLTDLLCQSVEPISAAITINDSDTLSRLQEDNTPIWTASGFWSPSKTITLCDLRKINKVAKAIKLKKDMK